MTSSDEFLPLQRNLELEKTKLRITQLWRTLHLLEWIEVERNEIPPKCKRSSFGSFAKLKIAHELTRLGFTNASISSLLQKILILRINDKILEIHLNTFILRIYVSYHHYTEKMVFVYFRKNCTLTYVFTAFFPFYDVKSKCKSKCSNKPNNWL